MKPDYPCSSADNISAKTTILEIQTTQAIKHKPKVVWKTRYFRWRSLEDYQKKKNGCFICKSPGNFAKDCPQLKKLKDIVHLFEEIVDHAEIYMYLNKEDDLKLVFSLEKEPMKDTIFFVDVNTESGDISTSIGEDNQKLTSQSLTFNTSGRFLSL